MSKQDGSSRQTSAIDVDDATATILHVDMDAFFASVELLERPDLRGRPVIVAHDGPRSVVTAATYEARRFGVNSAMPLALAKRRCPQAIVLEPHFDRYRHYSAIVMKLCDDLTPRVERLGIDEAFLDVAGARRVVGSPAVVGALLRERVKAETGLICSVGAAATKFVAKLASGRSKPDGLLVIPLDKTLEFLHPLPISNLWGVGGKTEEQLARLGLRTIGDLALCPTSTLANAIGNAGAEKLHNLSWGVDPRSVETRAVEKSVGHEVTFETDVRDAVLLRRELLRLSNMVAVRLRRGGMTGRTIALKLRFGDFSTITRSRTIAEPTDLGRRIYEEVTQLYDAVERALFDQHGGVRLIGVRVEQLGEGAGPASLWDDDEDWREAEGVIDAVSERFGSALLSPASLLRNTREREAEAKGFARDA